MLVRQIGVDLRIAVNQDRLLTEFEFREFEVEQRQKTAAAVVHRIVVIRIVFQLLQRNRLQQRLQAFVQPAFDARTQVHVIRFVVSTVRFTLNSTDGEFHVHVLLSFRVEDIPSGISRLISQAGKFLASQTNHPAPCAGRMIDKELCLIFLMLHGYQMLKRLTLRGIFS